jgi:putative oxygen-independent coproporphyrinogen III oxidase
MAGLYVHVPFCSRRCRYCAFASSVYDPARADGYLRALAREAAVRRPGIEMLAPNTVFVGGGTPSLLSPAQLLKLGEIITAATADGHVGEMTAEANPGSVDARRLAVLREFGFNRLSLGAQSFDPDELELLGRDHTPDEIEVAVNAARHAGFESVGLDLIFGLPAQQPDTFLVSLGRALDLGPDHVSLYGLTWEPGTPMGDELAAGLTAPCSQELEREMYLGAVERLGDSGYEQYEIANFAFPGKECRHNLNYWKCDEYVGLGAAAFSYLEGRRFGNVADVEEYCARVESDGSALESSETLESEKAAREALMLGLRMTAGVRLDHFRQRTGFDAPRLFGESFETHRDAGRLEIKEGHLRLTLEGILVANTVMADFI